MIQYKKATTEDELQRILQLQKQNLPSVLNEAEIRSQGFVTVDHSYAVLKKLNDIENHIIAKEGENVVAYLLAMTEQSQNDIPVLISMFQTFRRIPFAGKSVSDFQYIVVGQVCVDKNYRGKGILDECYAFYQQAFKNKYAFAITEIAANNPRSLNAHKRIGFEEIFQYNAQDGVDWVIVIWDWNNLSKS
jgi:predicted GNAT superfamily acetyltransferase